MCSNPQLSEPTSLCSATEMDFNQLASLQAKQEARQWQQQQQQQKWQQHRQQQSCSICSRSRSSSSDSGGGGGSSVGAAAAAAAAAAAVQHFLEDMAVSMIARVKYLVATQDDKPLACARMIQDVGLI